MMLRLPSRSPEGEVVGTLLNEPHHLPRVQAALKLDDFSDPVAKTVYRIILELAAANQPINGFAVQERLPATEMTDQMWAWKTDLCSDVLPDAIQSVKEYAAWRRGRQALTELLAQYDRLDPTVIATKLIDAGLEFGKTAEAARQAPTRQSTGIPRLDEILGGGWPTDAIVQIAGHQGAGRTKVLEMLLINGTPHMKHSLMAVTDSSMVNIHERLKRFSMVSLTDTITTLSGLVQRASVRKPADSYHLFGIDSVDGMDLPEPTATEWRRTVRALRAPLFLVTNQLTTQTIALKTNADIVLEVRANSTFVVQRNRFGRKDDTFSFQDIAPKQKP